MTELVTIDVGGTHARFAMADIDGDAISIGEPITLETADFPGLEQAPSGRR